MHRKSDAIVPRTDMPELSGPFRAGSWNLLNGFQAGNGRIYHETDIAAWPYIAAGRHDRHQQVIEGIAALDETGEKPLDVIFFPESYGLKVKDINGKPHVKQDFGWHRREGNMIPLKEAMAEVVGHTQEISKSLGYTASLCIPYDDRDKPKIKDSGKWYDYHMIMSAFSRNLPLRRMRLRGRNAIETVFRFSDGLETPVQVVGMHNEDRSEKQRTDMVASFIKQSDAYAHSILIGDLNALDPRVVYNRHVVQPLAALAALFPHETIKNLGSRLHEMGEGSTIESLRDAGFDNPKMDTENTPTMKLPVVHIPFARLDHAFVKSQPGGEDNTLLVTEYETHKFKDLDRNPITLTCEPYRYSE